MSRCLGIALIIHSYLHFLFICFLSGFSFAHSPISSRVGILRSAITPGQSGPGSNDNEGVLQIFRTEALLSNSV